MANRLELHEELCEILGSRNVYYNPPMSVALHYPCIVYNKAKPNILRADDRIYMRKNCYDVTCISKNPEDDLADRIAEHFTYANYDRSYKNDNLCHDALTIYY